MLRRGLQLIAIALFAACLPLSQATAQKAAATRKNPCARAKNQNEMNRCAAEQYQKADAELNRVYQQTLAKLPADHQEKVKEAQRAWIPFRDAHCESESFTFNGGSMQPLIRANCLEATTRARTEQLRGMVRFLSR